MAKEGEGGSKQKGHGGKPKNFARTFLRILSYVGDAKGSIALVLMGLIVTSAASIAGSLFLQPIINDYIIPGDFAGLSKALMILGIIYLAGVAAAHLQIRITIQLAQKTIGAIRQELFDKMQYLPLRYFDTHTHGELMSRFSNDAENITMMLEQSLTQMLSSVVLFTGSIICMVVLSPFLFISTLIVIGLMMLVVKVMGSRSRKYFQSQQAVMGKLNGNIEEIIGGLREIKAFNHEAQAMAAFDTINEDFKEVARGANFFSGAMMPIMMNLNSVAYALTAVIGGVLTVYNLFDIGKLASYLQFSRQIGQPINQVSNQLNNIFSAVAGAERIFEMMDETPEVDEGDVVLEADESDQKSWNWVYPDGKKVPLRGDVRFDDVTFAYDAEKPVLKNISLYAKPGQMIAFVGSTGAGKTTITNLINRFYDVGEGSITVDGIKVRQIKKNSLRLSLGMVLQDTHLFTGTVLENIRYGRLAATDEECIEAAKNANAHSFIKRLPNGYQTKLKGDGGNLSQGQRQLLAIARAYIAKPPVMILDEATSSIDTRTERLVQDGMGELMKGRTVFVIAHRLSTVRRAKAIIVLEHGEIVERGDHEELLANKGRYYQLHHGLEQLT